MLGRLWGDVCPHEPPISKHQHLCVTIWEHRCCAHASKRASRRKDPNGRTREEISRACFQRAAELGTIRDQGASVHWTAPLPRRPHARRPLRFRVLCHWSSVHRSSVLAVSSITTYHHFHFAERQPQQAAATARKFEVAESTCFTGDWRHWGL